MNRRTSHSLDARSTSIATWSSIDAGLLAVAAWSMAGASRPAPASGFRTASRWARIRPAAGPVAAEWIQANDPHVQSQPPCTRRLVERLRGPNAHRLDPHWRTSRTRTCARRRPGPRGPGRPGDLRRQHLPADAASDRITPGSTSTEHARHQSTGQVAAARLRPARVLELVVRLQPELGARFLGPHPPEYRVDPTPTWMHRSRTTTRRS